MAARTSIRSTSRTPAWAQADGGSAFFSSNHGNGWVKPARGDWLPMDKARFTADANPVLNIDAGAVNGRYFLATCDDIARSRERRNQV